MKIYKKIFLFFLSAIIILVVAKFTFQKSEYLKQKAKWLLPFNLITFFKVVTNFDGNLFQHYENDYKVKFLPQTQFIELDFKKYKLDFIRRSNFGGCPFNSWDIHAPIKTFFNWYIRRNIL